MQKLYYIPENRFVPTRRVSSTARRGRKWNDLVQVGDEVALTITGTEEVFGRAVVVAKEVMTYDLVLDNAGHNHVAFDPENLLDNAVALGRALDAAYDKIKPFETFTVLHLLRISTPTAEPKPLGELLEELAGYGVTAVESGERLNDFETYSRYEMQPNV